MADPVLTIRDLRIRVPGMGREAARRLGEAVARELAGNPGAPSLSRQLSHVDLRVQASVDQGTQALARQIAASVRRSLP